MMFGDRSTFELMVKKRQIQFQGEEGYEPNVELGTAWGSKDHFCKLTF
jgi:hypothetical protein